MWAMGCSLLLVFVVSGSLAAKSKGEARFKVAEVKPFILASGVDFSQSHLDQFQAEFAKALEKENIVGEVVAEGATVPDADAADSIVIEAQSTSYDKARAGFSHHVATMDFQISLYRRSDHSLITTLTPEIKAFLNDDGVAKIGPRFLAYEIKKGLK